MPGIFTYTFDTPVYKGTTAFNTGLFINGQWVDPVYSDTIDIINPATDKIITSVSLGSEKDVDIAVGAAWDAYKSSWGLKCPGAVRGQLLNKLADLLDEHNAELCAIEALDVGRPFEVSRMVEITQSAVFVRYYAGWADKISGETLETNDLKFAYTRREPYGVVGQIIPWNVPLLMAVMKIAPALATGNTVVLKPSEIAPLSVLKLAHLINDAGFPPGVVNIINGYGPTVGHAIAAHPCIMKIAFTGSTHTGRLVSEAAARSNLKDVSLELGGKSPTIVFEDGDLEQAVKWATNGVYHNSGQICFSGTRIFVHENVYDAFLTKFTEISKDIARATGDPFEPGTRQGPLVSQTQYRRVIGYIESGKSDGATVHLGGSTSTSLKGYFVEPTIFTDVRPDMKIMKEEIFGPVSAIVKFRTEKEVIDAANETTYGLGCHIFTENVGRAVRVAHALEAGTAWVNFAGVPDIGVAFGGYKQSGIGRDFGLHGLNTYTQVKAVHINLGISM